MAEPSAGPEHTDGSRSVRAWQVVAIVVVVAIVAVLVGVLIGRGTSTDVSTDTTATTATSEVASTGTTASTNAVTAAAPTPLDDFIAAAVAADAALTEAAARINAATTETEITYDQQTHDLLASAAPQELATTLPAGMPDDLQRAALLVYSDLVSRWAAMAADDCHGPDVGTFPRSDFVTCFNAGAEAAARFDGDLAALRQSAAATPFTVAAPDSHEAADLAVRVRLIRLGNLGCASTGGYVATDPISVVWQTHQMPGGDSSTWDGYVEGVDFQATYDASAGWNVVIAAC